jgi:uncharacterized protein (DUF2126 family)
MIGEVQYEGTHIALRQAIEPWHVLGEEVSGGGHGALRGFLGGATGSQRSRTLTRLVMC